MITSKDNSAVKALKKRIAQPRRADERMVIEGVHAAQMYMAHVGKPLVCWVAESACALLEVQTLIAQMPCNVVYVSDAVFRDMSGLAQGVSLLLEVARPNGAQLPAEIDNIVLLDGLQDAGNMGSILRSAAAAGVRDVVLNAACVNPFSPKVLRASVGAHFALNIIEVPDLHATVAQAQQQRVAVVVTSSHATHSIYAQNLRQPVAGLLGSEGAGVAPDLMALANACVTIPMAAGESLNVAAAAAVCLFEMQRQQSDF